jgi:hypothetical protein
MPFIGPIVKPALARYRARKVIDGLDAAIAERGRLNALSPLEGLGNAERFRAVSTLLEATLLARTRSHPAAGGEHVETYLQRYEEEYSMAHHELKNEPATRAEVVALGLALKEVALSLDAEIAGFRGSSQTLLEENRRALTALRTESMAMLGAEARRMDARIAESTAALQRTADRTAADVQEQIALSRTYFQGQTEQLRAAHEEMRAEFALAQHRLRMWLYTALTLAAGAALVAFIR